VIAAFKEESVKTSDQLSGISGQLLRHRQIADFGIGAIIPITDY
jgi:hypothetical protein